MKERSIPRSLVYAANPIVQDDSSGAVYIFNPERSPRERSILKASLPDFVFVVSVRESDLSVQKGYRGLELQN